MNAGYYLLESLSGYHKWLGPFYCSEDEIRKIAIIHVNDDIDKSDKSDKDLGISIWEYTPGRLRGEAKVRNIDTGIVSELS